jgi:hypothetical protein
MASKIVTRESIKLSTPAGVCATREVRACNNATKGDMPKTSGINILGHRHATHCPNDDRWKTTAVVQFSPENVGGERNTSV